MKSLVLEYGADGAPCVNGVVSTEGEVLRFNASGKSHSSQSHQI